MASRTRRRCFRVCCCFNTNSLRDILAKQMNTKSGFGPDARLPQCRGIALRLKGAAFSPATASAMRRLMPVHPFFARVCAGVCRCGLSRLMLKYGAVAGLGRWHAARRAEASADRSDLSGGPRHAATPEQRSPDRGRKETGGSRTRGHARAAGPASAVFKIRSRLS